MGIKLCNVPVQRVNEFKYFFVLSYDIGHPNRRSSLGDGRIAHRAAQKYLSTNHGSQFHKLL